jgi:hypothetical protein
MQSREAAKLDEEELKSRYNQQHFNIKDLQIKEDD